MKNVQSALVLVIVASFALGCHRQEAMDPQMPATVSGKGEHSAWRTGNESFQEALARHEKQWLFLHPGRTLPAESVTTARRPVKEVDLSKVPLWGDSDLRKYFKIARDQRFLMHDKDPDFPRRLTWLYPDDGCYSRAELVKSKALENKLTPPFKLFAFGELAIMTPNHPNGYVTWWYHVAPLVKSASDHQTYVLDPAVEPARPIPWKEWLLQLAPSLETVQVTVADPNAYTADSLPFGEFDHSLDAVSDLKFFLDQEWSRQVLMSRNPYQILGDGPPWHKNSPKNRPILK